MGFEHLSVGIDSLQSIKERKEILHLRLGPVGDHWPGTSFCHPDRVHEFRESTLSGTRAGKTKLFRISNNFNPFEYVLIVLGSWSGPIGFGSKFRAMPL